MGDRIVVMHEGHIQQIDSPLRLYNHPVNKFVAGFIGSPSMNFIQGDLVSDEGLRFRAHGEVFTIALGDTHAATLGDYGGKEVILGIRPEDLYVAGSSYAPQPVAEINLTLDVLEPMGNEIFVYASSGEPVIVARVAPQSLPEPGQPIRLAMDLAKLYFFDVDTEKSISAEHLTPLAA